MGSGVMDVRVDFIVSGLRFKTWDLLLCLINISILITRVGHNSVGSNHRLIRCKMGQLVNRSVINIIDHDFIIQPFASAFTDAKTFH